MCLGFYRVDAESGRSPVSTPSTRASDNIHLPSTSHLPLSESSKLTAAKSPLKIKLDLLADLSKQSQEGSHGQAIPPGSISNLPTMIKDGQGWGEKWFAVTNDPSFAKLSPEDRIRAVLSIRTPNDVRFLSQFFEKDCKLHSFKQTSPTTSVATFRFRVERFYCNGGGNLHGAAQSLIYDHLTSLAVQAVGKPGGWIVPGVSRSLNCTYLRPAPEGIVCLCECEVMHTGRSLALMRGVIKRESDGAVISTCEHDKAFVGVPPAKL